MKNPHIKRLMSSAKQYHRTHSICLVDGITVPGGFNEVDAGVLSFYADLRFILNDYQVHVFWRHPRCLYKEMTDELVGDVLLPETPMPRAHLKDDLEDIFGVPESVYKPVGRSRKKLIGFRFPAPELDHLREHFEDRAPARSAMAMRDDNGVVARPFMTSVWTRRHRFVRLCTPVEVQTLDHLRELAQVTKRLLRREATLGALYPGYQYTVTDWIAEASQRRPHDDEV